MREIKFRGLTRTGRWVYGSLVIDRGDTYIYWRDEAGLHKSAVLPDTIGQYTGLKSKSGVEIYEGDILSVCTGDLSTGGIGRVVWFESGCNFAVTGFLTEDHHHAFPDMHQEGEMHHQLVKYLVTEVIGNIHENPELLNEEPERAEGAV